MNNPFKSPNYGNPDSTFNLQNLANFGRVGTATRRGVLGCGNGAAEPFAGFPAGVVVRRRQTNEGRTASRSPPLCCQRLLEEDHQQDDEQNQSDRNVDHWVSSNLRCW
jgi:hypothetical protein